MYTVTTTRAAEFDENGKRRPFCQTLDLLKEAGFTFIDWYASSCELLDNPRDAMDTQVCKRWAYAVREYAQKRGVRFVQMHSLDQNYTMNADYAHLIDAATDNFFQVARILGVSVAAIHPIITEENRRDRETCLAVNVHWLREKADKAAECGIQLAVENMLTKHYFDGRLDWRFCINMQDLCALVEGIGREDVGYCFDVGHANYMGIEPYAAIMRMGKKLIALHVHDNDTFSDQHLLPWQGTVDFQAIVRGLAHCGYNGNMTMEVIKAGNLMPIEMARDMLRELYTSACCLCRMVERERAKELSLG